MTSTPSRAAVLVADDELQLLPLMQRILEGAGYDVHTAPDGDEAVRVFDACSDEIGVAVLDAAIAPEGSGKVVEALFRKGARPALVLTSGDVLSDRLSDVLFSHDGIFLRKPFSPSALLRAVEDVRGESP